MRRDAARYPLTMTRLLTPDDTDACVQLRRHMLRDSPWSFAADPGADRGSDPVHVAAGLADPEFAYAGSFHADGRLVSVALLKRETNPKRRHIAWIVSVYTHPDARRQGRSRAVLEMLIENARNRPGVAAVYLSVGDRSPAAQRLYEALGFVAWGVEPDAYRIGDESSSEIHMRLEL